MEQEALTAAAGWYQDERHPGTQRFWDGTNWTDDVSKAPRTSRWRGARRWLTTGAVVTVLCLALSLAVGVILQWQSGSLTQGLLGWAQGLVGLGGADSSTPWWLLALFIVGVVGVAVGLVILAVGFAKSAVASARAARESPHLARGAAATAQAGRASFDYGRMTVERSRPRLRRATGRVRAILVRRDMGATPPLEPAPPPLLSSATAEVVAQTPSYDEAGFVVGPTEDIR